MKKIFVNIICAFIPSKKIRHQLREKWIKKKLCESTINVLCKKMFLGKQDDIWTLYNGVKFYCPLYPWDLIQRKIIDADTFYENAILESLNQYIPANPVILDIGANIGNHSVYWATICKAKKIYAFEPVLTTFNYLLKNIELNNLQNIVEAYNYGLGDKNTSGQIDVHPANNIGETSIKESKNANYGIKIKALDELDISKEKVDFVKIDVESFELKTLAGMKKTLEKYRPIVFIESFPINELEVKKFFKKLGYKAPIFYKPENWLFLP
jgi:FkbM family methyltransferase